MCKYLTAKVAKFVAKDTKGFDDVLMSILP